MSFQDPMGSFMLTFTLEMADHRGVERYNARAFGSPTEVPPTLPSSVLDVRTPADSKGELCVPHSAPSPQQQSQP